LTPWAPPNKKIKLDSTETEKEAWRWVQHGGSFLSIKDKASIVNGEQLNDEHVNFAQQLLKAQIPSLLYTFVALYETVITREQASGSNNPFPWKLLDCRVIDE
jgi:hypothetical protein